MLMEHLHQKMAATPRYFTKTYLFSEVGAGVLVSTEALDALTKAGEDVWLKIEVVDTASGGSEVMSFKVERDVNGYLDIIGYDSRKQRHYPLSYDTFMLIEKHNGLNLARIEREFNEAEDKANIPY